MNDIRYICKVFLDFVYDHKMIPDEIFSVLEEHGSQWDFRLICKLLQFRDAFRNMKRMDEQTTLDSQIAAIVKEKPCFARNSTLESWTKIQLVCSKLGGLWRQCNDFFHNVSNCEEVNKVFVDDIRSLIEMWPDKGQLKIYLDKLDTKSVMAGEVIQPVPNNNQVRLINSETQLKPFSQSKNMEVQQGESSPNLWKPGRLVDYTEIIKTFKVSIQQGMNLDKGVVLINEKGSDSKYTDYEDEAKGIRYHQGQNIAKDHEGRYDQERVGQNAKFCLAVDYYKKGQKAAPIRVFAKERGMGCWVYKGEYDLIEYDYIKTENPYDVNQDRCIYRFSLRKK